MAAVAMFRGVVLMELLVFVTLAALAPTPAPTPPDLYKAIRDLSRDIAQRRAEQNEDKAEEVPLKERHDAIREIRDLSRDLARKAETTAHSVEPVVTPEGPPTQKISSQQWSYNISRPVKVVLWTESIIFKRSFLNEYAPNCNVERAFVQGDGVAPNADYDISDADVVVFHLGMLKRHYRLPRFKPKGQLWIAGCWEPVHFQGPLTTGDCSLFNDDATMRWMDGVSSYHNSSDFPAFFTPPTEEQLRRPAPPFGELDAAAELATSVFSDCRSPRRNEWMTSMNSTMGERGYPSGVLFYGDCYRNAYEPHCNGTQAVQMAGKHGVQDVWIHKANRCLTRPFALVAENSVEPWYVTEKLWNAIATGAMPVYFGPVEAGLLAPPGSTLFARDFLTEVDLVETMLSYGEREHAQARAWKQQPVSEWGLWQRARQFSRATLLPRLCEAAAARMPVHLGGGREAVGVGQANGTGSSGAQPGFSTSPLPAAGSGFWPQGGVASTEALAPLNASEALSNATEARAAVPPVEVEIAASPSFTAGEKAGDPASPVESSTQLGVDDYVRAANAIEAGFPSSKPDEAVGDAGNAAEVGRPPRVDAAAAVSFLAERRQSRGGPHFS